MTHQQVIMQLFFSASPYIGAAPNGEAVSFWYSRDTHEIVFVEFHRKESQWN